MPKEQAEKGGGHESSSRVMGGYEWAMKERESLRCGNQYATGILCQNIFVQVAKGRLWGT